ncbi:hypothetical protein IWW37_005166 [Coemansia sp. RSA 2050]|nr:hypothetical protein IWW37_005166 [Coemansia sp. RSA 2050]
MQPLPPFQFLPLHVVRLIVNHVALNTRLESDYVHVRSEEYLLLLRPLMWVCSNFRAVAYPLYCSSMIISTVKSLEASFRAPIYWPSYLGLGYPWNHLIRDLGIFAEERDIYSGATLEILSQDYGDDCPFPLARKFTLIVGSYNDEYLEYLDNRDDVYQANIDALILWVKQMLPKVSEIKVELGSHFDPEDSYDHHCNHLISQLYQLGTRIVYHCESARDMPATLCLDKIRNLVFLEFNDKLGSSSNSAVSFRLARQHAQTLQSLILAFRRYSDLANLIQNPDGSFVVYPCVHTLKIREHSPDLKSRRPAFPGAVPFPILRCLTLKLQYPFDGDTLFRGNAATLESLTMNMDSFTVSMLRRLSVFTPTSHPRLWCVNWEGQKVLARDSFATSQEEIEFVLSIGPGAPVRGISGISSSEGLLSAPSLPGDHSSIRVLSIPSIKLDLWQAISLIKALLFLSDLYAPLPSTGSMPDGITWANISEHVVSTYAPMGKRFRCWHLEQCSARIWTRNAQCVLLLALVCPNFGYVSSHPDLRESLMDTLETSIDLDIFRPYAPRLGRLLFKSWRSC